MLTIHLEKTVTLSDSLNDTYSSIWNCKYKDLPKQLNNINEVMAVYPYGMKTKKLRHLERLGFKLKQVIWFNNDMPYSKCKEVWSR